MRGYISATVNITVFWDVEPCDVLRGYEISEKSTVYPAL